MDQNLTTEETMQLESKLRVATARFELQRRDDALSAARTAVTTAKGVALQAHCRTLLGRAYFGRLLDEALSKTQPNTADQILAAFQQAVIADSALPIAEGAPDLLAAEAESSPPAIDASVVTQSAPMNESDRDLALRRQVECNRVAESEMAATTCLRAWLELVVCCSPWEAWDAAGKLAGSDHYRPIRTTAGLLSRFNDSVLLQLCESPRVICVLPGSYPCMP